MDILGISFDASDIIEKAPSEIDFNHERLQNDTVWSIV